MYRTNVMLKEDRIDEINAKREASKRYVDSYDVRERQRETLPLIDLSIDVPLYRMANGRTQTAQRRWISRHGVAPDFFSSGEENVEAQQAQHEILAEMARRGRSESLTPIIDELERQGQTEHILITETGVVVNGNRRLAAMRELYSSDSPSSGSMASVTCAVLPRLTEDEIDDIELRLQMAPETKLPYGWINEALTIRRHLSHKEERVVASTMRKRPSTIQKQVAALTLAETYLSTWRNAPYEYDLVESGEQFFSDLVTTLDGKEGAELEALQKAAFLLYDAPREGRGRIYNLNKVLRAGANDLLSSLGENLIAGADPGGDGSEAEEIEIDFGEDVADDRDNRIAELAEVLSDPDRREEVSEVVVRVATSVLNSHSDAEAGRRALEQVKDAYQALRLADLSEAAPDTYDQIEDQLETISKQIQMMQVLLKEARTKVAVRA